MNGVNFQILVVLLFLGFSFANWLIRQAKEQQAKQRVQQELERRRREALRTGRDTSTESAREAWTQGRGFEDPDTPETAAAQREELARRRREQFERMRQRQQQQLAQAGQTAQASAQAPAAQGPQLRRQPGARPVRTPAPPPTNRSGSIQRGGAGTVSMPRGGSVSRQAAGDLRLAQGAARKRREDQLGPVKPKSIGKPISETEIDDKLRVNEIGAAPKRRGPRATVLGQALDRDALRRAIVTAELLQPPLALRPLHLEAPGERRDSGV